MRTVGFFLGALIWLNVVAGLTFTLWWFVSRIISLST